MDFGKITPDEYEKLVKTDRRNKDCFFKSVKKRNVNMIIYFLNMNFNVKELLMILFQSEEIHENVSFLRLLDVPINEEVCLKIFRYKNEQVKEFLINFQEESRTVLKNSLDLFFKNGNVTNEIVIEFCIINGYKSPSEIEKLISFKIDEKLIHYFSYDFQFLYGIENGKNDIINEYFDKCSNYEIFLDIINKKQGMNFYLDSTSVFYSNMIKLFINKKGYKYSLEKIFSTLDDNDVICYVIDELSDEIDIKDKLDLLFSVFIKTKQYKRIEYFTDIYDTDDIIF